MQPISRAEKNLRNFKLLCFINLFYSILMAIRIFDFSPTSEGSLVNGEWNVPKIVIQLTVSVLFILASILGYLRKLTPSIILCSIVVLICACLLVFNIITMSAAMDWRQLTGTLFPILSSIIIAIAFIYCTRVFQKDQKEN